MSITTQADNGYHFSPYSSASKVFHTDVDLMTGRELNRTEKIPNCSLQWHPKQQFDIYHSAIQEEMQNCMPSLRIS